MGPQCAAMLLDWLKARRDLLGEGATAPAPEAVAPSGRGPAQGAGRAAGVALEGGPVPGGCADDPVGRPNSRGPWSICNMRSSGDTRTSLTKAERLRLDNTIQNALFKIDRYVERLDEVRAGSRRGRVPGASATRSATDRERPTGSASRGASGRAEALAAGLADARGVRGVRRRDLRGARLRGRARRRDRRPGGRPQGLPGGLLGVVQCKYFSRGVVGSPELQKFLGTIHHTRSHKGFFVTTRTFTLAADKFASRPPDRADRRPQAGRAGPGGDGPRRQEASPSPPGSEPGRVGIEVAGRTGRFRGIRAGADEPAGPVRGVDLESPRIADWLGNCNRSTWPGSQRILWK